jgi:signal transduction histidine kinase/HAMP domain-containing protein/CheY-like chemotaxis protein
VTDTVHSGPRLDRSGLEQLLAGLTAVRGGDFSTRLAKTGDPLMDEIATEFNGMADQLDLFTSEVTRVAREVGTEGKLGGQAYVPGVSGTWKDLTESVNAMAGNLTGQVRNIAQVATAVAKGDLSQKIDVDARGEILELKSTLNTMVDQLSSFADEVTRVAREVGTDGLLGGQADVKGVSGTWKDLTESVNVMAANLTDQVRSIAEVTTAVAKGDLSQKIRVDARGEIMELKETINTMVDQLSAFADEVTRVAREVGTEGNLGGQATVHGVSGTWKDLTDNVNSMATNLTNQVRNIAQVTTAVAEGDLSKKIDVDARGEILQLKTTINTMVDQLSSFAAEVTRVAREVGREGKLGGQAEVEGVSGTWKRLTENVNELSGTLTRQVRAISEVTSAVAAGDLTRNISVEAEGEVAELKDSINTMVRSLRETVQASQDQDWLKTNLASIGSMLQGHRDLEVVAELIMEELAPLLGAQHGTFFLTEDWGGERRLRLIAGYGLRADKDAPIQYRIGQSLIGQVAKSRRPIVVNDIPQGYIKISSGLGEASPANLAIMPVLFEDQVLGVVELASFTKFTSIQIAFLEQLAETLGISVNALIANSRTDLLLEESQRLTAELQARSSELQARSEELQRSNADLEDKAELLATQKQDIEAKNAEIEQAREEIEERARQLALASQYKSQFLANMSHELRTPLNSLLILARLLAQNPGRNLTGKQVEYANVIHSAGSDLLQLINDILDLSKVEAGRMDVRAERFTLAALLEDIQATFRPLTAEKGLEFEVAVEASAPTELVTDRQRLRQVLGNLVSNAVKFTERGQVTLRVAADGSPGGPFAAFSVTDTGIGIAPENLAVIFGAFQQGDGTLSRRYGGTGLGLSIASEVSALLGGRISATSDLGHGSTFTLSVPSMLPEIPPAVPAPDAAFALSEGITGPDAATGTGRLAGRDEPFGLIERHGPLSDRGPADAGPVDHLRAVTTQAAVLATTAADEPDLPAAAADDGHARSQDRKVLVFEPASGGLLTLLAHSAVSDLAQFSANVRVSTATSPTQGAAMLAAEPFRCVVVDLGMPGTLDFLDQVQEKPELRDIPVLAHAPGQPGYAVRDRLTALSVGYPSLELLPSLDELRERITLHLSAAEPRQVPPLVTAAPAPARAPLAASGSLTAMTEYPSLQGKHVLVIDDDARNVFAITSTLDLHGLRVTQATDGRRGIEELRAAPDTDLILMDVMMPGMDGYATMAAIRQMPQFGRLPIIAVTARAMPGDREKSLAAGANDYVTKPVDTDELLACMERWLTKA